MSERYEMSYSDNYLLMTVSWNDVKTKAERDALEEWKLLEVNAGIKREQLQLLNQVIRDLPKDSVEFMQCKEEAQKCVSDCSTYERQEWKLRSGILKEVTQQIKTQVLYSNQYRPALEAEYIRRYNINSTQALELLYSKESQTIEGRKNVKLAGNSILIKSLDQKIDEITLKISNIEVELSKLKWCLSKEKRSQKANLTEQLNDLGAYIKRLQAQRRLWSVVR